MMDGAMNGSGSTDVDGSRWNGWTQFPVDGGAGLVRGAGAGCPEGTIAACASIRQGDRPEGGDDGEVGAGGGGNANKEGFDHYVGYGYEDERGLDLGYEFGPYTYDGHGQMEAGAAVGGIDNQALHGYGELQFIPPGNGQGGIANVGSGWGDVGADGGDGVGAGVSVGIDVSVGVGEGTGIGAGASAVDAETEAEAGFTSTQASTSTAGLEPDLYRGLSLAARIDRQPLHPPQHEIYPYFAHRQHQASSIDFPSIFPHRPQHQQQTPQSHLQSRAQQQGQQQGQQQDSQQGPGQFQPQPPHFATFSSFSTTHIGGNQDQGQDQGQGQDQAQGQICWSPQGSQDSQLQLQLQLQAHPTPAAHPTPPVPPVFFPTRPSPDSQLGGFLDSLGGGVDSSFSLPTSSHANPQFFQQHQQPTAPPLQLQHATSASTVLNFKPESPTFLTQASNSPLFILPTLFQPRCSPLDPAASAFASPHPYVEFESSTTNFSSSSSSSPSPSSSSRSFFSITASPCIDTTSGTANTSTTADTVLTPLVTTSSPKATRDTGKGTPRASVRATRHLALLKPPDSPQQPMTPATDPIGQRSGRQPFPIATSSASIDPRNGSTFSPVFVPQQAATSPQPKKRGRKPGSANKSRGEDEGPPAKRPRGRPRLLERVDEASAQERRRTQIRVAQRAYRDRKDQAIIRLEAELGKSRKARNEVIQGLDKFVEFINERKLQGQEGPDFEIRFKELTDSVLRYKTDAEDASRLDGGASSDGGDDLPITQGSWIPNSNTLSGTPSDPDAAVSATTAVEKSPEPEWDGHDSTAVRASNYWPNVPLSVELVSRPHPENASFPACVPDPKSHGSWMRPEGSASTAAEFSAQALALLGSSDLELKKLPFATRLQQAVFQRTVSPDVIVVPDRIESGELRPSPVYVPVPAPKSIPAVEGYSTPLGTTIWNASEDTRVPEMEHRLEFVGKDDTRYVGAHPAAARWTSPRVRDMELWGHSQAQKARHAELNGGIHAEHEHPEESANSSINLDGRWTTKRDRDRRIWGTDQPRRIQDAHLHGRMEGVHPSDENNGYHDASSGDSKWASKRDRDRAIWGHPQVHEVQDMSIDDRMQEDLSYFQEEFLDARGVEVYLSDRGIRLQKQRNTASVEIDPNDFKGSFHLFADGRRGSDGTGGSGHSIVFLRGATNPAPLESSHPDVAKAAATVHQESINTMFTDMTATGATDTGSYSANLCPAIPITDWMKHNPGKAKLTIDINLLLKELANSAAILKDRSGPAVSFRTKDVDRCLKIATGIWTSDRVRA